MTEEERTEKEEERCGKCGQTGNGLYGEYPCSECGRPTLHDPEHQENKTQEPVSPEVRD